MENDKQINMPLYPPVKDPAMVGEYPALVKSGGGYVWDDVLEYRVWCHPHDGAPDTEDGNDYYYPKLSVACWRYHLFRSPPSSP